MPLTELTNIEQQEQLAEIEVPIVSGREDVDSDYQPSTESSDSENVESENYRSPSNSEPENNEVESDTHGNIGRPRKGRKIKFSGQTFKTMKMLKHANKPYYTEKGKFVEAKKTLITISATVHVNVLI